MRERMLKSLKPNAAAAACTTVRIGNPEEGDPNNRLVRLTFDEYPGNDAHAKQQAALDGFFGWADSTTYVEHTDELLEASRKARSNLSRLHADFSRGLKPGEYILVKSPFEVPGGGREWMWVEVRKWDTNALEGLLENEPDNIPDLHRGQLVRVREEDVFDYIRNFPDGHEEGNTTKAILEKLEHKGSSTDSEKNNRVFVPNCSE